MDDVSPEELRYEAYTARAANTMDQHINKVKGLVEDATGKRNTLKNPDQNLKQVCLITTTLVMCTIWQLSGSCEYIQQEGHQ